MEKFKVFIGGFRERMGSTLKEDVNEEVKGEEIAEMTTSCKATGVCRHCGYGDRYMCVLKMRDGTFTFVDCLEACLTYSEDVDVTTYNTEAELDGRLERMGYAEIEKKAREKEDNKR